MKTDPKRSELRDYLESLSYPLGAIVILTLVQFLLSRL